ncbi:LacI family DNA-binding transcriptional regulator [Conexibacter sp. JD483]|uniref:LacI family DNA-binding transcriptional regulator n=1 Tax=unclassified Conexibacter TaxID=2627773 RepID=UPI00271ED632|nr:MULTISPECIES: LacI family DNA-binding transcriptional regulator [unclassified Conexibacter]MDO8188169.1 LacI family DNA-binding transcriptional regulator [Conexibacter sp. CPCC 205706]MDO8201576.1 LacI family DNA-binding transcriptional regulator [Conexibacter sp. CPCC 205762]MDR9373098.1 LacI family DNA-binding transcriptional regulator [Conexibacter sp. JD483]
MASERPGIRDVARAAGVSRTTVSHALNGKGRVAEETRERILAVAERLGYRPNTNALHLTQRRTGLLALASSPSDPVPLGLLDADYFLMLAPAASEAALRAGYALVLGPSGGATELWSQIELDGALITDPLPSDPFLRELERRGTPYVTLGRDVDRREQTWWVDSDLEQAMVNALDHLEAAGARRIGFVAEPPRHSYSIDELRAYESWQAARDGAPLVEEAGGNHTEAGYHAALRLLDAPDPPDGIVTTLEGLALGVKLAAETRALQVPGELKIASVSDGPGLAQAHTSITAVDLAPAEIGATAVRLLIDRLEGRSTTPEQVQVPSTLRPRATTRRR